LFHADGTLFDFERAEGTALEQAFGLIGVTFVPGYLATYQRLNQALWQAVERGEITPGVIKVRRFFVCAFLLVGWVAGRTSNPTA
jgi:FMN phosphatase YigB (HAD superfamily)